MSEKLTVSVETPIKELNIGIAPLGLAFAVTDESRLFMDTTPSQSTHIASSNIVDYDFTYSSSIQTEAIDTRPYLNIKLGTILVDDIYKDVKKYRYRFVDFEDSGTSSFSEGDIVLLEGDTSPNANDYQSKVVAASVAQVDKGAYHTLYIFLSHVDNTLIAMSKGYFDLEDSKITNWAPGRTLYIDGYGKFNTIAENVQSQGWVRSVGYCVPNNENKKRIWFEPDKTYIQLK